MDHSHLDPSLADNILMDNQSGFHFLDSRSVLGYKRIMLVVVCFVLLGNNNRCHIQLWALPNQRPDSNNQLCTQGSLQHFLHESYLQRYRNMVLYFSLPVNLSHSSQKTKFDISCKLSTLETICMKCQILFSGKIRNV